MEKLFSDFQIGSVLLKNRIAMSPMCMNQADVSGNVTDWNLLHYATRAVGGVGLILLEATAVQERGRINAGDLGIWSDAHIPGLKKLVDSCQQYGAKVGIQLAHSGRKCRVSGADVVSVTENRFSDEYGSPRMMELNDIKTVIDDFSSAAKRTAEAGFDLIEIHAAHGYLINQFLSPVTNKRSDEYGGELDKRVRFLSEIIDAVREEWPSPKPLMVRLSAVDNAEGGHTLSETKEIISFFRDKIDLWDLSSGGIAEDDIKPYYGFQVPYAEEVKREMAVATAAVGMITTPEMAAEIITNGRADLVLLGRELLRNPYWPMRAAAKLNIDIDWPVPYLSAMN